MSRRGVHAPDSSNLLTQGVVSTLRVTVFRILITPLFNPRVRAGVKGRVRGHVKVTVD